MSAGGGAGAFLLGMMCILKMKMLNELNKLRDRTTVTEA
jgi:hypothetical protein